MRTPARKRQRERSKGGQWGRNAGEAALILVLRRTHHFAGQLKIKRRQPSGHEGQSSIPYVKPLHTP